MLTQQGYDVISEEEYFNMIIANLQAVFPSLNTDPANIAIVNARMFARNEARRDQETAELYNSAYVSTATGYSLDKAVWIAGIKRDAGDFAVGKITITKKATSTSMIIPAYSEVVVENKIYITQNTTNDTVTSATYEVDIKAQVVGTQYNIPTGTKMQFVSPNVNVESIITSTDIIGGTNLETDEELRARFFYMLEATKNSSLPSIISQVSSVNGVTFITGKENNTDAVSGDGLPPHSIEIQVVGGTDEDVAEAIVRTKAGGIATHGTTDIEITIDGVVYNVKFTRIQDTVVYYKFTVVVNKYTQPQNIIDLINERVIAFTNGTTKIRKWDVDADVAQADESIIGISATAFGTSPNPTDSVDIIADSGFKFKTTNTEISIDIVEE